MSSIACEFCSKIFKSRGLKTHRRACLAKKLFDSSSPVRADAKHYKIILGGSDDVFEHILSFLGNQTLSKLEDVTGDHYVNCDRDIAQWCCAKCENDKPAISDQLCTACYLETNDPSYHARITTSKATELYGIRIFQGIPSERGHERSCGNGRRYTLYYRTDLDEHMINKHGSVNEWLRAIGMRMARIAKAAERASEKAAAAEAVKKLIDDELATTPRVFRQYLGRKYIAPRSITNIRSMFDRYQRLQAGLAARNLGIRDDSRLCSNFIENGSGNVENIVNITEEMSFLFKHTDYGKRSKAAIRKLEQERRDYGRWMEYDDYQSTLQSIRDDIKNEIRMEYSSREDIKLPLRWLASHSSHSR